jgi:hypothetical protein
VKTRCNNQGGNNKNKKTPKYWKFLRQHTPMTYDRLVGSFLLHQFQNSIEKMQKEAQTDKL